MMFYTVVLPQLTRFRDINFPREGFLNRGASNDPRKILYQKHEYSFILQTV